MKVLTISFESENSLILAYILKQGLSIFCFHYGKKPIHFCGIYVYIDEVEERPRDFSIKISLYLYLRVKESESKIFKVVNLISSHFSQLNRNILFKNEYTKSVA